MFMVELASWMVVSLLVAGMAALVAQERFPSKTALLASVVGALVGGVAGRAVDVDAVSGSFSTLALSGAALGAFIGVAADRLALRRSRIER